MLSMEICSRMALAGSISIIDQNGFDDRFTLGLRVSQSANFSEQPYRTRSLDDKSFNAGFVDHVVQQRIGAFITGGILCTGRLRRCL